MTSNERPILGVYSDWEGSRLVAAWIRFGGGGRVSFAQIMPAVRNGLVVKDEGGMGYY